MRRNTTYTKMSSGQPTITVEHIHHRASHGSTPTSHRRRNSASPPTLRAPTTNERRLSAVVCPDAVSQPNLSFHRINWGFKLHQLGWYLNYVFHTSHQLYVTRALVGLCAYFLPSNTFEKVKSLGYCQDQTRPTWIARKHANCCALDINRSCC